MGIKNHSDIRLINKKVVPGDIKIIDEKQKISLKKVDDIWMDGYISDYISYLGSLDSAYDKYHELEKYLAKNFNNTKKEMPKWDTSPMGMRFKGYSDYEEMLSEEKGQCIIKNIGKWKMILSLNKTPQLVLHLENIRNPSEYLSSVYIPTGGPYFRFTKEGWEDYNMRRFYFLLMTSFLNGQEEFQDFLAVADINVVETDMIK